MQRTDPTEVARQLCDAIRANLPFYAQYWLHNTMAAHAVDDFAAVVRSVLVEHVCLRLDQNSLYLLPSAWSRLPLRLCGGAVTRQLYALLSMHPCPFRIHVDMRTFKVHYTHFAYDAVVDNYLRREEVLTALVSAAESLFPSAAEKSIARHGIADVFEQCAASALFDTHPLARSLRELADRMRQTK
jgi:hypothetical protein